MNRELLVKKIGVALGVSSSEREFAFELFINHVADTLEPGGALKIPKIGVFQIQKESGDVDKQIDVPRETPLTKKNLIYSPPIG